jgi:hypothetical protein
MALNFLDATTKICRLAALNCGGKGLVGGSGGKKKKKRTKPYFSLEHQSSDEVLVCTYASEATMVIGASSFVLKCVVVVA